MTTLIGISYLLFYGLFLIISNFYEVISLHSHFIMSMDMSCLLSWNDANKCDLGSKKPSKLNRSNCSMHTDPFLMLIHITSANEIKKALMWVLQTSMNCCQCMCCLRTLLFQFALIFLFLFSYIHVWDCLHVCMGHKELQPTALVIVVQGSKNHQKYLVILYYFLNSEMLKILSILYYSKRKKKKLAFLIRFQKV